MNKSKLLITEKFRDDQLKQIEEAAGEYFQVVCHLHPTDEEWLTELADTEYVIGQPPIEILQNPKDNCPKLKMIQMLWAGTDMYTRSSFAFPKGQIMLANGSGAYGMIMSQFVIGMTLSLMLNFKTYHDQQQNKIWQRKGPILSLDHARVLIFGAGDIGTAVAGRLRGFDAYCIGVCRNTEQKRDYFQELCTLKNAEKYIPDADVIVGCIPNSAQTEGYMNRQRLKLMKESAVIVNVGRGNFIDCMALDELLRSGAIRGAALDVTNPEPLPENHPLWDNPGCMITPHASGATFGHLAKTEDLLCWIVCENIERYCNGKEIRNRIF